MKKITFIYQIEDGKFGEEDVWASSCGVNYKVENIPFFTHNIAYGDVISVEIEGNRLFFLDLIKTSEHSAIQIVFFDVDAVNQLTSFVENLNCSLEGIHEKYISVDVPPEVDYIKLKDFLEIGLQKNKWDYKEACLSATHDRLIQP